MNKKLFCFLSLLVLTSLLATSCSLGVGRGLGGGVPGSGKVQKETRALSAFKAIVIEYPGAVITIQPGEEHAVEIEADDNLLPQISTEVLSGTLTIKSLETDWKDSVNPSRQVVMIITVKELHEVSVPAPVGDLEVNGFHADRLKVLLNGGAQLKLNDIQVQLLDTELSGAGNILAKGTAEEIKLILSGVGSFNAADLKSTKAAVELSGMGSATVYVEKDLTATLTGAGSIEYYGTPHVEQNVTGAGSIKPAD